MANEGKGSKVAFELLKSNYFRVIHADGAWGGVSPRGDAINMAVYSERNAIPRKTEISVIPNEQGQLVAAGEEKIVESRGTIIRELEAEVIMDLRTARAIREWLDQKIKAIESGPKS